MKVYLDNAASTALRPEVLEHMTYINENIFANPSSVHTAGQQARNTIEQARKKIAGLLDCQPSSIFFTSGGTEANNWAIHTALHGNKLKQIISSPLEHHSVLNTVKALSESGLAELHMVHHESQGRIDTAHLEELLSAHGPALVSLAHANNETGTLLPVKDVSKLCRQYKSLLHLDMVQTIGHYPVNLYSLDVDMASWSAHKFHGPKATGGLYLNLDRVKAKNLIHGGAQEQNMRAGTENMANISGMALALELFYQNYEAEKAHISQLKEYLAKGLEEAVPGIRFLGQDRESGLYSILNALFPGNGPGEMLLYMLDMKGVYASAGAACSSGTIAPSHVIEALGLEGKGQAIRFSLSYQNTKKEVEYCIGTIKQLFSGEN